jgi:hypothetical protein
MKMSKEEKGAYVRFMPQAANLPPSPFPLSFPVHAVPEPVSGRGKPLPLSRFTSC